MTVWCSGKGGLCVAGGLGFESRRPHSPEIYAKKDGDGWTLTGGGLHQLKKITFFLVKILIFFGFFRFQLCRVSALCREAFAECPTKNTRQRRLYRVPDTRQSWNRKNPKKWEFLHKKNGNFFNRWRPPSASAHPSSTFFV